jgi:hypothetical protein
MTQAALPARKVIAATEYCIREKTNDPASERRMRALCCLAMAVLAEDPDGMVTVSFGDFMALSESYAEAHGMVLPF